MWGREVGEEGGSGRQLPGGGFEVVEGTPEESKLHNCPVTSSPDGPWGPAGALLAAGSE